METDCAFCRRVGEGPLLASTGHAVVFLDDFPVSPGHCLVVPRRHVASYFQLSREELTDIWQLASEVERLLRLRYVVDGMNVGINVGAAAGQRLPHAHVHLIPRYLGDAPNVRGGVRRMLTERPTPTLG